MINCGRCSLRGHVGMAFSSESSSKCCPGHITQSLQRISGTWGFSLSSVLTHLGCWHLRAFILLQHQNILLDQFCHVHVLWPSHQGRQYCALCMHACCRLSFQALQLALAHMYVLQTLVGWAMLQQAFDTGRWRARCALHSVPIN